MPQSDMNEKQFQSTVLLLMKLYHWKTSHFGNTVKFVRRGNDYRTIPDKQAAGFPDIVAVRGGRVIFAELKREKGQVSKVQQEWLDALALAEREVYVWRPSDLDEIEELLRK